MENSIAPTQSYRLNSSSKTADLIERLAQEAESASRKIEDIRGPDEGRVAHNKALTEKIAQTRGRNLVYPFVGSGLGNGPLVELEDGSVKLDLINGIGIHVMGHSHPQIIRAALRGALCDVVMQGNLEPNKEYLELHKKLVEIAGRKSRLKYAWLATCGTMANENALKACRQKATPARMIIAMENAFAGRSTLMAEVTDNPAFKVGLPSYNEVLRVPWYNKKDKSSSDTALRIFKEHVAKHENNISCFTFEPMQGEGGYNVAPREFFVPMLDFCKQKKIPVWLDEVQTFTRTGNFFAFETLGLGEYVDVCTVAKTLQTGATLFTEEMNPKPGLISGTFSGATVSLTTGLEILNTLDNGGFMGPSGRVQKIHNEFVDMLNRLNESSCKGDLNDAGGLGLMVAVTPFDGSKEKTDKLMQTLFRNGILSFGCGHDPYRLRFLIPAVTESRHIEMARKIIEKSILEMKA
jgi:4-aminobutyrate aminotransferase-like enzyme